MRGTNAVCDRWEGHKFRQWRQKVSFLLRWEGTLSNSSFPDELTWWFHTRPLCSFSLPPSPQLPRADLGGGWIKGLPIRIFKERMSQ